MHILDCTLRDGGYYTNWDFSDEVVESYIDSMNKLPVDILELGYRNVSSPEYMGRFGYCPTSLLKRIRKQCQKEIAIMLNVKSVAISDIPRLLSPIQDYVDWVRLAVNPHNIDIAISLAKEIKNLGFKVGFNIMYMSKWHEIESFFQNIDEINEVADIFSMVDSYGGVMPADFEEIVTKVKSCIKIPLGFHGHNNLQLALINSLKAIELGVEYIDATVLGMGRGAGNLNIELLFTILGSQKILNVDFNVLGNVVSSFSILQQKYKWGTSLPYMISGSYSIPQNTVMDWVSNRIYSFNSIVRALSNKKDNIKDNAKFDVFTPLENYKTVLVIGGGESVTDHLQAIKQLIQSNSNLAVVFTTSRHADKFICNDVDKYYILVGSESKRMLKKVSSLNIKDKIILPPYPREMGTDVPSKWHQFTRELSSINFISDFNDSCTAVALQTAIDISTGEILCIGFDGYPGNILSEKELALTRENREIFKAFNKEFGEPLKSLTPTLYSELKKSSIYKYIF